MIRLGSLAGYPFEGPRVLGGWSPPSTAGVFAVLLRPDPEKRPEHFAVIYVGTSPNFAEEGLPFKHPASPCWVRRAGGDRWKLSICYYEVPGGQPGHWRQIAEELAAVYHPSCNDTAFDHAWKEEWIGSYSAPTTGPLTTRRDPGKGRAETAEPEQK